MKPLMDIGLYQRYYIQPVQNFAIVTFTEKYLAVSL